MAPDCGECSVEEADIRGTAEGSTGLSTIFAAFLQIDNYLKLKRYFILKG